MTNETIKKERKPRTKKVDLFAKLESESSLNKETQAKPVEGIPYVEIIDRNTKKIEFSINLTSLEKWCIDYNEPYEVVTSIYTRPYLYHNNYSYRLVEPSGNLFDDVHEN